MIFYKNCLIYAGANRGCRCSSSEEVETWAIVLALTKAKDYGLDKVHILSSAPEVVKAIGGDEDWILRNFIQNIMELSKSFVTFKISHISRNSNVVAHDVAKFCFDSGKDFEWVDNFLVRLMGRNSVM